MRKGELKNLLKQGPVKAIRMTEDEFESRLRFVLNFVGEVLLDLSLSEIEEYIAGAFSGIVNVNAGFKILVIRLNGNKGFVFIGSPIEFVDYVKKRYGDIKKLIQRFV